MEITLNLLIEIILTIIDILFRISLSIISLMIGIFILITGLFDNKISTALTDKLTIYTSGSFVLAGILGIIHCRFIPLIYAKIVMLFGLGCGITCLKLFSELNLKLSKDLNSNKKIK